MASNNVAVVQAIYDAFSAGDIPSVLARMSPDIVWMEAENFPYADGNPYVGPQAVLEGVFARCAGEWNGFSVEVDELIDGGATVVALGRYLGTHKATGSEQRTQMAHIWRIKGGTVTRFQQFADTLGIARVIGSV